MCFFPKPPELRRRKKPETVEEMQLILLTLDTMEGETRNENIRAAIMQARNEVQRELQQLAQNLAVMQRVTELNLNTNN